MTQSMNASSVSSGTLFTFSSPSTGGNEKTVHSEPLSRLMSAAPSVVHSDQSSRQSVVKDALSEAESDAVSSVPSGAHSVEQRRSHRRAFETLARRQTPKQPSPQEQAATVPVQVPPVTRETFFVGDESDHGEDEESAQKTLDETFAELSGPSSGGTISVDDQAAAE